MLKWLLRKRFGCRYCGIPTWRYNRRGYAFHLARYHNTGRSFVR